ncbi:MAG: LysR family transcriptional regulator [Vulcanimicrobiaceae bacterium]
MELQQLQYFAVLARTEHVTQAAEELSITQPSLSRAIARLERDLGVTLFEHHGRSIRLNRYGRAFLRNVERALSAIEEGRRELVDLSDKDAGVVAFGFAHALGTSVVPDLIAGFRREHPTARFQLAQNASHIILAELEAGEVDLALVSPMPAASDRVASLELTSEELFLVVPHDHRLAKRRTVRLCEVRDDPFVCLRKGYGLRALTDDFCAQAGFVPNTAFEGEEIATLRGLVAAGLGVALIPAPSSSSEIDPPRLRVSEPFCRRSVGLMWIPGRYQPHIAQRFRAYIASSFPKKAAATSR